MTLLTSLDSSGSVPYGPLKFGAVTTCIDVTDTTILNLSTTNGVLWGFRIDGSNQSISDLIVKMTVDGAAEETLDLTGYLFRTVLSSVGLNNDTWIPLPRRFNSSLTLKINVNVSGANIGAFAMYTEVA